MQEIFKDIQGYEGLYQVSNLGGVKSLSRFVNHSRGGKQHIKEKMLKPAFSGNGYLIVSIYNGKKKSHKIHQLVAVAFLNHNPCGHKLVVDHRDFDRSNNHLSNLKLISQRENSNQKHLKSSSKYVGVSLVKSTDKWYACITINGKNKNLGCFVNELEASRAYQNALKNLTK